MHYSLQKRRNFSKENCVSRINSLIRNKQNLCKQNVMRIKTNIQDKRINKSGVQNKYINNNHSESVLKQIYHPKVQNNQQYSLLQYGIYSKNITSNQSYQQISKVQQSTLPYFLDCLKRKNQTRNQFYINIHTSIMIFKEFLKYAKNTKPKSIDFKIPAESNRKTIVFDMDQTLIHTNNTITACYELRVPFREFQGHIIWGYVNVRPYAKEIIKNLSVYFDVIIFTAGSQRYADPILDHIDPQNCIKHRLYRQSCTFMANQLFVKDLRILGRNLANVVLIDNAPYSYLLQLDNGIPILNFVRNRADNQLYLLEPYLMSLLNQPDVRTVNQQMFKLAQYVKYDSCEKLILSLYAKYV